MGKAKTVLLAGAGAVIAMAAAQPGMAQSASPAAEADGDAGEIIVTAQKREEKLRDVPISISVLGGAQLDRTPATGSLDILRRVPGVIPSTPSLISGGTAINLRGVASGGPTAGGASTVAFYVDSVPFGFVKSALVPDTNLYDLDRIEIQKGPQGTLYGANSVNGVVRVLTRDANLDRVELKARADVSTTKSGGEGYRGDAAVNIPLVEGKLAVRLTGGHSRTAGWIDIPGDRDANTVDATNVRAKINAEPNERLKIAGSVWVSRTKTDSPMGSDANDFRATPITINEYYKADFEAYGLNVGYEFDGFTLASSTSYIDFINSGVLSFGVPLVTKFKSKVFAEELLLNSSGDGPWLWSLGAFYRDARNTLFQDFPPRGSILPAPFDFNDNSKSIAVFGQITRKLFEDRLEVTGGLRYFRDKVRQIENQAVDANPTRPLFRKSDVFTAWTPRAALTWHTANDGIIYASYSQGFRSGFNQDPAVLIPNPGLQPARPDRLHNFEIGTKGLLADGLLEYEAAVYYIKWNDVQQLIAVPVAGGQNASAIVNSSSASGAGFDLALTLRPTRGLSLSGNVSYNGLEVDDPVVSGGVVLFRKGERLNFSSKYTMGASLSYEFPLGGDFEGRLSASVNRAAGYSSRLLIGAPPTLLVTNGDNITEARASFTLAAPRNWEATFYVENLTNKRRTYETNGFTGEMFRQRPRTIGLQLEYKM